MKIEPNNVCALQKTLYNSKNPVRRWLHCSRRDSIIETIGHVRNAGDKYRRAMEVGPGSGVYLPTLCSKFDDVTALDVEITHINAIEQLRRQHKNLHLVHGDLTKVQFSDKFDFVLCSEVLEHVQDPAGFVKSLGANIEVGGCLVLTTPQPFSLMELTCKIGLSKPLISIVRSIYKEPVLPTGHISLMSRKHVIDLLASAKFRIIETRVQGLYIPVISEFGGRMAVKICNSIEKLLLDCGIEWPLWTQIHIAIKE